MDFVKNTIGGLMGGQEEEGENEEITHESGAGRMAQAMFCAICCAPFLMLGMVILLGWNEKRAVCTYKAIEKAQEEVKVITDCGSTNEGTGSLVMFTCDYQEDGLTAQTSTGDFAGLIFPSLTGMKTEAEMYQCVESSSSKSKKDSVGGGKTTTTTYSYSKQWKAQHIDSARFHKKEDASFRDNCGVENPAWPSNVPASGTKYSDTLKIGAFETKHANVVPLDTILTTLSNPSPNSNNWAQTNGEFKSSHWAVSGSTSPKIGDVSVTFKGNNAAGARAMTVLGMNNGGKIEEWTAPADWLCGGEKLNDARMGEHTKAQLFEKLKGENSTVTWVIRIIGFLILWFAWSALGGPLEIAADCVPCIGPYLGDAVQAIVCAVSCLPATACCMFVVAVCWIAMRPYVGIPLMLICIGIFGGLAYYKWKKKQEREQEKSGEGGAPDKESAAVAQVVGSPQQPAYSGPVPEDVARAFLGALRQEYVQRTDGAVGEFFGANGNYEAVLAPFEDRVRQAGDSAIDIDCIGDEWNLKSSE